MILTKYVFYVSVWLTEYSITVGSVTMRFYCTFKSSRVHSKYLKQLENEYEYEYLCMELYSVQVRVHYSSTILSTQTNQGLIQDFLLGGGNHIFKKFFGYFRTAEQTNSVIIILDRPV